MKRMLALLLAVLMVMSLGISAIAAAEWTVTYHKNNGKSDAVVVVADGEKAPKKNPAYAGYILRGWFEDDGTFAKEWDFDKPVTKNLDLYAAWDVERTVTFDPNGGELSGNAQIKVADGKTVAKPADPTRTGYDFKNWHLGNAEGERWKFNKNVVESDITLVAKWVAKTYNITYKDMGNVAFSGTHESGYPTTHTYDAETTLKSATKTGYDFNGWFTTSDCADGTKVTSLGAKDYTADFTLYAKWTAKTTTVTLDDNGGTGGDGTVTATYDSAMLDVTVPTLEGHTFAGYFDDATEGTQYYNADGSSAKTWDKDAETATLYAHWDANTYSITYLDEGGEAFTGTNEDDLPTTHTYGIRTNLVDASKTGYNFMGWYIDSACSGNALTKLGKNKYTNDITLYAKWEKQKYDVKYIVATCGVEAGKVSNAPEGQKVGYSNIIPAKKRPEVDPSAEGYKFAGWYKDSEFSEEWDFDTDQVLENPTNIYAKWLKKVKKPQASETEFYYNGEEQFYDVGDHKKGYYTVSGGNSGTDAGTYTAVYTLAEGCIWGNGDTEPVELTWEIKKTDVTIELSIEDWTYGDEPNAPVVTFKNVNGEEFEPASGDIVIKYALDDGNKNFSAEVPTEAGDYLVKVKVKGSDNYSEKVEKVSFTIEKKDITGAEVTLGDVLVYNRGQRLTQEVEKVVIDGIEATFEVSDNKGKEVGKYTLTITGTGNFKGEIEKDFVIIPGKGYNWNRFEDKHGNIEIGDGVIAFNERNGKNAPEVEFISGKGDIINLLIKMGELTADDIARIYDGEEFIISLETSKVNPSNRTRSAMEKKAGKKEIDSFFDLEFSIGWKGSAKKVISDIHENGYLKIGVEAPDVKKSSSREYSVIRSHDNRVAVLSASYSKSKDMVIFSTNKLSTYAVAYSGYKEITVTIDGKNDKEEDKKEVNPNTGALIF